MPLLVVVVLLLLFTLISNGESLSVNGLSMDRLMAMI